MSSPRRSLLLLIPAAGAALALAGCAVHDDGPRTSQTRDVAAFTRLESRDGVDVRLHVGEPQRVRVHAGGKVIDDVRTEVRGGTLVVSFDRDSFLDNGHVLVDASVPELTRIDTSGSGDVAADGLRADALEVRSEGSADLALQGTAGRLTVSLEGSGDADLGALAARDARVALKGSGDVDVRADRHLDIDIEGSGDVRYHGNPELNQSIDGSGDLTHAE